jgi:hypothetical protein
MRIEWESGAEIRVTAEKISAVISANKAGLLSLARQLAALAEESPEATSITMRSTRWKRARQS